MTGTMVTLRRLLLAGGALVVLGVVVGGGVAVATPVTYTASAVTFVAGPQGTFAAPAVPLSQAPTLARTYAEVASSRIVLDPVIAKLHLRTTAERLSASVSAENPDSSALIDIAVVDPSPATAARIANAVQDRLATAAGALTPSAAPVRLMTVQRAAVPDRASSPVLAIDLVGGGLGGLLVGLLALAVAGAVRALRARGDGGIAAASML